MSTTAYTSIEDDLAQIRGAPPVSTPDVSPTTGRSIDEDLAAVRHGQQIAKLRPFTPPPIAADATRVAPGRGANADLSLGQRLLAAPFRMMEGGPMTAAQMIVAPIAAAVKGAQFAGQSLAETTLPDDIRARALADPERISEEDAALAGLQLAVPTLPATGIIGRAVVGAGTGAVYAPEDPAVGAIVGGAAGGAGAALAGERVGPGLRLLVPNAPAPFGRSVPEGQPKLPPGPPAEPAGDAVPDQSGRHSVVDADVVADTPAPSPPPKLLPRVRVPVPEEPTILPATSARTPEPEVATTKTLSVPGRTTGTIEGDLAALRTATPDTPVTTPSLRDARGRIPANLTQAPLAALTAEYRRLIDTGQEDATFVRGVEDSPGYMEHREMTDMPEDRRGVKNADRMAPAAMARTRMENREKSLTRIEAEFTRRGIAHGAAYHMAEQAATGSQVGEAPKSYGGITPGQQTAFEKARARPEGTATRAVDEPKLAILHNLSAENLKFADTMGGLAVPSLGIVKQGQHYSGMGEITLLGKPHLGDPKEVPIHDADVYSPTFPRAEYPKANRKAAQQFSSDLGPWERKFDDPGLSDAAWRNAVTHVDPQKTISTMLASDAAKAMFLQSRGIDVAPVQERVNSRDQMEVHRAKTRTVVAKAMTGREAEFKEWVESKVLPMHGEPFLRVNRQRVPFTLANIVQAMTGPVKNQQQTMTFGEGQARAKIARKFDDQRHMRNASYRIGGEESVNSARAKAQQLLHDYRVAVADYYGHTYSRGHVDTWGAMDASMRAIARWARGRSMQEALRAEGFRNVPAPILQQAKVAGQAFIDAPVPYFEAKPQRAVTLDEFAGAVVPKSASPETRAILAKHGIAVEEFASATAAEPERGAAIARLQDRLEQRGTAVLFERRSPYGADVVERHVDNAQMDLFKSGAINPETDTITFGSKAKREAVVQRVQQEAGDMASTERALPTSAQRIRAIGKKQRAWVDIRGQTVGPLEDLHRLLTPFRDPKMEMIGSVLVDDTQKIVAHTLETSGALNYVTVGDDVPKWVHQMVARAQRAGATKVFLHHNHPSGDPEPSPDDRAFTILIANHLASKGIELLGHYVIDHTTGTWIEAQVGTKAGEAPAAGGVVTERHVDVRDTTGPTDTDWTATHALQINLPEDIHRLVRATEVKRTILVAYVDAQHHVVALEPHARAKLEDMEHWLPARLREHGAASTVVLAPERTNSADDPRAVARRWNRNPSFSRRVLDLGVVSYGTDDVPVVKSLYSSGDYDPVSSRYVSEVSLKDQRLPRRLFEQSPEYGRKKELEDVRDAGIKSGLTPEQASAYAAAAQDIDFDGAKAVAQAKIEAGGLRTRLQRWADAAADQTRAIDRLSRKAVEKGMPPERSPEYELALSYNSEDTIRRALYEAPEMATTHGVLDPITREPMGPTLESVVKPLSKNPEKVRQAFTYVVALRKVGRGLQATAGSEAELHAAVAAVEALGQVPLYRQFAQDLEAHLNAIGRYAVRSGLWTPELWEKLKHSDLFYIPFQRLMTHIEPPPSTTTYGTKRANVSTGIESFEGSRRFLANPVEAVAGYDARIIKRADAARVGAAVIDAIVQHLGDEGKAILTPLSENSPEVRAFTAAAVRQNLAKSGLTPAEAGMVGDLSTPIIDAHNPVVWRYSRATGAKEYYLLHQPDLYKALMATRADSPLGQGALMTAFRLARRIMTVTNTGINPRFALGLNIARDVPQAVMQNPGMRLSDILVAAREALKATFGRSDFADLMARHGLGSASIFAHNINPEAAARKLAPVTQGQKRVQQLKSLAVLPKALELLERVGAASDLVGRLSAARARQRALDKSGATSRGAAAGGAVAGMRGTVNFNRRSGIRALQVLEQTVPFFGASVRSIVRATEAIDEVPGRVGATAAILTLLVLAEWAYASRDTKRREQMVDRPATERDRFLQFGGVRYPLPQEMAVVVAGLRSALAQVTHDDPDHAQQLKEAIYNLLPPVVSDLVQGDVIAPWPGWREVQEIARNKASYGQRPIVPERLKDLPPSLQRSESTSPTFDVLASLARKEASLPVVGIPGLADTSPLAAEHLVRGFLGNMTPLLTTVTDAILVRTSEGHALPVTIPAPLATHPLNPASAFLVREPPSRTASESWFYARDKEFTEGRNAEHVVRKMEDQAETPAGRLRVAGTKQLLGGRAWALSEDAADDVRTTFAEAKSKLAEYRDAETGIRQRVNDGTLNPHDARSLIDALTVERQGMLRATRKVLQKLGVPE